ncbi:phosphotransacetylase [Spiroplasma sabaudiense Ar-1343]|uniref:Phosphate acetyltransferase n=1 Tax=Spiroplasma sabaudiense Ar-1343 TaxID=1276257 RepID=W6AK61_9MOLU|nr:phosphate acetyltransferase [Spiroplasma sabaudiense]AHI54114.1 phosphotransacetylase [Spiroplasma sabaudiense Ar-1343]
MFTISQIEKLLKNSSSKLKIIFPEGEEEKIINVANQIAASDFAIPVLVFRKAKEIKSNLHKNVEIKIIENYDLEAMANNLFNLRNGKTSLETAMSLVVEPNYFATMLLELGEVDSLVCGLKYSTADTLRPALQIIKTKPEYQFACSSIIMSKNDLQVLFADCSLNVSPDSAQLAKIAKMNAEFAKTLGEPDPQVAMLSYSTLGSGKGLEVEKVAEAVRILKTDQVDFNFGGEIQFDAAFSAEVRQKKAPDLKFSKQPNVFIFPDLNSGNIGYKIAQRMGDYVAAGPFILGLNKPVNDLSRGATLLDVYNTAIITLFQALANKEEHLCT